MRFALSTVALCSCLVMLASCGTAFRNNAEVFERTHPAEAWGKPPPPRHQEIEKAFALKLLKDPDSARFEHAPAQRWTSPVSQTDTRVVPTWRSVLLVNAKNSFGGYAGAQQWQFFYYDGELFLVATPTVAYPVRSKPLPPGPVQK